jgi:hypothetical protein
MADHGHGGLGDGDCVTEIKTATHINLAELRKQTAALLDLFYLFFLLKFSGQMQWSAMMKIDHQR